MFPVTDFNFMVAGIATFAATVGYTYARGKLNTPTRSSGGAGSTALAPEEMQASGQQATWVQSSDIPLDITKRRESLKRKEPHDGFEEEESDLGYPHNLANIYPRKRCRTPSSDNAKSARGLTPSLSEEYPTDDWIFVKTIDSPPVVTEPPRTPSPEIESLASPAPEVTDSPILIATPTPANEDSVSGDSTSSTPVKHDEVAIPPVGEKEKLEARTVEDLGQEAVEIKPSLSRVPTSTTVPVSPFPKISLQKPLGSPFRNRGFADFAGNKSPFGAFTTTQTSLLKPNRPIWTLDNQNDSGEVTENKFKDETEHVITQAIVTAKPITNRVTGEEEEDVEMELKGVKLFVKRGNKPFAEGIAGHFKLLAHKTTLEERLLFRREPLWKVSMNVRINPSVRCSYDPSENALRILTQEPVVEGTVNKDDGKPTTEIVVYAMKPGRLCSKQDFKEFSETLIKNSRLKPSNSV